MPKASHISHSILFHLISVESKDVQHIFLQVPNEIAEGDKIPCLRIRFDRHKKGKPELPLRRDILRERKSLAKVYQGTRNGDRRVQEVAVISFQQIH